MDRLSNLPDAVLHHILSFMPMQDVVQTAVLSKRWENLSISVPNLFFNDFEDDSPQSHHYFAFVSRILILRGHIKLKSFRLELCQPVNIPDLDVWLRYAFKNDVEELFLDLTPRQMVYELPHFFYTYPSIRILKLKMCDISFDRQISWSSLKSLTLWFVPLDREGIQTVLLGCPKLEFLEVRDCEGFNGLSTNSTSLKKLIITDKEEDGELRISAPNVTSLNLSGYLCRKCLLVDMSSLLHASIAFDGSFSRVQTFENHQNMLFDVLGSVAHVENLTLGTWCIKVLSIKEKKGLSSRPSKRKSLTLITCMEQEDLPGILHMLKCSPSLEKLVLCMSLYHITSEPEYISDLERSLGFCNFDGENYLTSQEDNVNCLMHYLKTVYIRQFVDQNSVFPLVEFLLKKAEVLEKMVIRANEEDDEEEEEEDSIPSDSLFRTSQKLLAIPRSSPGAVVMFLA